MIILRDKFIKDFCVRKKEHLTNPPIHDMANFVLPKGSQLHYISKGDEIGIPEVNDYTGFVKDKVCAEFVLDYLDEREGGFKRVTVAKPAMVKDYFSTHHSIINAKINASTANQLKNLLVTNYGLMEAGIDYFHNDLSWYSQFLNKWRSIFKNVFEVAEKSPRMQFIVLDLPRVPPSLSLLKKTKTKLTKENIRKFGSTDRLLVAGLWDAYNDEPEIKLLNPSAKALANTFIIFRFNDNWLCYNMATVQSWLKTVDNPKGDFKLTVFQKKFLVMLLTPIMGSIDDIELDDEDESVINTSDVPEAINKNNVNKAGLNRDGSVEDLAQAFSKALDMAEDSIVTKDLSNDTSEDMEDEREERALEILEEVNQDIVEEQQDIEFHPETDSEETKVELPIIDYQEYTATDLTHEEAFNKKLEEMTVGARLTPREVKGMAKLASSYKTIKDPRGQAPSLEAASIITAEELTISKDKKFIDKKKLVADDSMLASTLKDFDQKYINSVMHKDIFNMVLNLQRHGFAIRNYEIKKHKELGDEYEIHSVKIIPIHGKESTISFKVPVIDKDGVFISRSVKNRMRKQRSDVPIRKVGHDEVALTSYMSKMFVERSQFSTSSSEIWLKSALIKLSNPDIKIAWGDTSKPVNIARVESNKAKMTAAQYAEALKRTPRLYAQLARIVTQIKTPNYTFYFDVHRLNANFGEDVVSEFDSTRHTQILVGKGKDTLLVLTNNHIVHECSINKKGENKELGHLLDLIGLDRSKSPLDAADIKILSKSIPLGVLLGFYLGLGTLLKTTKVKWQFVPKGSRLKDIPDDSIFIRFNDGTLCITEYDYKAQLIFAGYKRYQRFILSYDMHEFDKEITFGTIFSLAGLQARFLREFNILRSMWVDPITREELIRMGEPTDFILLLFRAVELLEFDQYPDEMDRAYQRDRGYERISGFIYEELITEIRKFDSNPIKGNAKLTMNPNQVWMRIIGDETTTPIEESNPIHNLKESEAVVYRGSGGRSARTMSVSTRKYTANAIGVDSEGTVDNGDAGTIKFLTANPNYNSVRGTINLLDNFDSSVNSSCMNTSTLLAPCVDLDDPKRRNFVQIQNSRTTNCAGMTVLPCRTGYEYVMAHRVSDLYASIAEEDGVVTSLTENAVIVKHASGKETIVELGKRDGKWSGKIIPHHVTCELKVGQKVSKGDTIAYNPLFFQKDVFTGELVYKTGMLCRTALVEEEYTYEDSCLISEKLASKLNTYNCEERTIKVLFEQDVNNLVKVGDDVNYDTVLCVIQNSVGGLNGKFAEGSLEALMDINSLTPKAKLTGKVTKISAVYCGDIEEMSPSLQKIVSSCDRQLFAKAKDMNKERVSGQKSVGDRHEGKFIDANTVYITITFDITQGMEEGSKLVFGHQMKSVVSKIVSDGLTTEDGQEYDAKFSYASFAKRIVNSGLLVGILNTFMVEAGKRFCEIYENQ